MVDTALDEIVADLKKRDARARRDSGSAGAQEYEVRVIFSLLATTLNLRASDPAWTREPTIEDTLGAAFRIVALLERDDLFDAPFRTLVRHNVALMVAALPSEPAAIAAAHRATLAERERREQEKAFNSSSDERPDKGPLTKAKTAATNALKGAKAAIEAQNLAATLPPWKKWFAEAEKSQDARTAYNLACFRAARGDTEGAVAALKVASLSPELKLAATKDPILKSIVDGPEFRKLVAATPRSDYWSISPLADLKAGFARVGIRDIRDLVGILDEHINELAAFLHLPRLEVRRIVRLAGWFAAIDEASLRADDKAVATVSVELASAMLEAGVETPTALDRTWPREPRLYRSKGFGKFVSGIEATYGVDLNLTTMKVWVDSLRGAN